MEYYLNPKYIGSVSHVPSVPMKNPHFFVVIQVNISVDIRENVGIVL